MAKTVKEPQELKKKVEDLSKGSKELSEEELQQVNGGVMIAQFVRYDPTVKNNTDPESSN